MNNYFLKNLLKFDNFYILLFILVEILIVYFNLILYKHVHKLKIKKFKSEEYPSKYKMSISLK